MAQPARKEGLRTEHQVINIGPSHPVTHGTVKMICELDGESVVDIDIQVGYLHRGFEKECESGTWYQAIPYTDRLGYTAAILANLGYCMAVEKLIGCPIPRRCEWARVLGGELSRIGDHLTRLGAACLELGAMTPFLYGIEAREIIWDLQDALCGARVTSNYIRIGGIQRDVPDGFLEGLEPALRRVEELLVDFDKVVTANRIFVDRFRNTGVIPLERLIQHAVTGPVLRAAGIPLDLRKSEPYSVWNEIDFDVPIGTTGDNYDRFLVVQEEMIQSLRAVRQCVPVLTQTRGEPVDVDDPRIRWPGKNRVFGRMEELIAQFKGVTEGPPVPAGEAYAAVESPNGELGFYVVSDGTGKPHKVRCRPPSFLNMSAMREMVVGGMLADIVPTFDMVNMIGGECDR